MKNILSVFNVFSTIRIRLYPLINRLILKQNGAVVGCNVCIPGKVHWQISKGGGICIGDNLYFSSGDSVNPIASNLQGAVFIEKDARLRVGNNVGMSSTRLWIHESVTIGDNVKIGACVLITDTDAHPMDFLTRRTSNYGTNSAPVVIEDDVWIGAHTIILKGVTIGARSIVGAGSVVTRSIPADCVAAGNPCRVIKSLDSINKKESKYTD
jgi:acetyltransferase-like isoleucine patch superfamily enzyme